MPRLTIAGLDVVLVGGTDGAGGGDGPLVVLLHGYGAPGDDLVPLARVVGAPAGTRWAFPAAPLALPMPYMDARAWWPIDLRRFEEAQRTGVSIDRSSEVPPGMAPARERIVQLLGELGERLRPSALVLGGFSQGAMLTLEVTLRTEVPLAGVALLSGTLLAQDEWVPLMPRRKGLRVFQSHGDEDPLLSPSAAARLRVLLEDAGLDVDWVPFAGGHEIPPPVVSGLRAFLGRVLGPGAG